LILSEVGKTKPLFTLARGAGCETHRKRVPRLPP